MAKLLDTCLGFGPAVSIGPPPELQPFCVVACPGDQYYAS